jgi:hypothetical protein
MATKTHGELNDRTQWNSKSGRPNATMETQGPQTIANKDNAQTIGGRKGVVFEIGPNLAHNLASDKKSSGY